MDKLKGVLFTTGGHECTVVITSVHRWSYFLWFILGFYRLQRMSKIRFKLSLDIAERLNATILSSLFKRAGVSLGTDSYLMEGYICFSNGVTKTFCIDSADSPFLFDEDRLKHCDIYFKMQYPKCLDEENIPNGFSLTPDIVIPWSDHKHIENDKSLTDRGERRKIPNLKQYKDKIKPLMIGPRRLSMRFTMDNLSEMALEKGYRNYVTASKLHKEKKFMCYFGNSKGPVENTIDFILDYDNEGDILTKFKGKINHPNEKRAIVAKILNEFPNSDARIIALGNSDSNDCTRNNEPVPLDKFCEHISKFQYNANVSGYRLSIPNRFIESFMAGTAVITDKLHVRWYKPFADEVIESVDMGYLLNDAVNWRQYQKDLESVPDIDTKKILTEYKEKWTPEKAADYIVNTVQKTL